MRLTRPMSPAQDGPPPPRAFAARLLLVVVLVWLMFDRVATATGSLFGEAGLLIAALVLAALLLAERVLFGRSLRQGHAPWGWGARPAPVCSPPASCRC